MLSREFEFHAPRTLGEALELIAADDDVTVLAGGMSLMPMMNLGLVKPSKVLSLNHLGVLDDVSVEDGCLTLGACVRHACVATDPLVLQHCPSLSAAARVVGDTQVRNRGTIGGSIAHADPSADYLPVLAAVGASITLTSSIGNRTLSAAEFFIDVMFTAREPSELVTAVSVPVQPHGWGASYERLARVEGSFAIVNAAALVSADLSSATVALGGVGPRPVTLEMASYLHNGVDDAALIAVGDAAYEASEHATGDVMSDGEYRRAMARVLACRALRRAVESTVGRSR